MSVISRSWFGVTRSVGRNRSHDLAERTALLAVTHPTVGDLHTEEPPLAAVRRVGLTVPAEVIVDASHSGTLDRVDQRTAEDPLDLGAEPRQTLVLDHVLQPGPLAIDAVAVIPEGHDDRFRHVAEVVHGNPGERRSEARVGALVRVVHAEAAADGEDEAVAVLGVGWRG